MDRVIEMMRNPSSLAKATNSSNNNNNIKKKKTSRNGSGSSMNSSSKTPPPPPPPCCDGKDGSLKRGPWTHEEDEVLSEFIRKEGEGRWRTLPKRAGLLRCGKSCRLRWINYLRPSLKRGLIAPDEEDLILRLHRLLGNRWSLIAGRIPGRTDNEIKNYWNTHLSKKLISQGIDPRTHKPLINSCSNSTAPLSDHSSKPIPPTPLHHGHHNPISNTHHHHLINIANQNYDDDPNDAKDDQNLNNKATAGGASAKDDVSAIGSIRSNDHVVVSTNNNEGEDHVNYCSDDDVFSSFLNSLINEDAFAAHHYLQSEHNITTTFSQNNPN